MLVSEALQNWQKESVEITQTSFLDVAPEKLLANLQSTVKWLQERIETERPPKPPLDPDDVWRAWEVQGFAQNALNRSELRTLCTSPTTALRPQLIRYLSRNPEPLSRLANFVGIVHAYFMHWRSMHDPKQIEDLAWKVLDRDLLKNCNRVISCWQSARYLFTPEAARRIAEKALVAKRPTHEICAELFVDTTSTLALRALDAAAQQEVRALVNAEKTISENEARSRFSWTVDNLLTSKLDPDLYRQCMAQLILSRLPVRFPVLRKELVQRVYNDSRLHDPRLIDAAPNWRSMPQDAKDTFLSWLAEETLHFFFDTLVPKNDENRRRADFWLKYATRYGNVKDFHVAVSNEDMTKLHRSRAAMMPSYARVQGANSVASSAFLMLFEGFGGQQYIVIEFSETGNAAYVYRRHDFEKAGTSLRTKQFRMNDLRDRGRVEFRIIHNGGWEPNAAHELAQRGIKP
jgi:EH_Signature domain